MQVHASKLVAKLGAIDELISRGPSGDIKERNSTFTHKGSDKVQNTVLNIF